MPILFRQKNNINIIIGRELKITLGIVLSELEEIYLQLVFLNFFFFCVFLKNSIHYVNLKVISKVHNFEQQAISLGEFIFMAVKQKKINIKKMTTF